MKKQNLLLLLLIAVNSTLLNADDPGSISTPSLSKNIYKGLIAPDVMKQQYNQGYYNSHTFDRSKVYVLGNTLLGFSANINEHSNSQLPSILSDHKVDVSLSIATIAKNLSRFSVDIKVKSDFLKGALSTGISNSYTSSKSTSSSNKKYSPPTSSASDITNTITARYSATVVSCDGESLSFGPRSDNIRDRIANLAADSFGDYLSCTLHLKIATSDKGFASDPFSFVKKSRHQDEPKAAGTLIRNFQLTVGPHGLATLQSIDERGNIINACIEGYTVSDPRPVSFTLQATQLEASFERDNLLKAAYNIADYIIEYADDRAKNAQSSATTKEFELADQAAFDKVSSDIQSNLTKLRSQFSDLPIQDQFLALSVIGRAYFYSDEVGARIAKLLQEKPQAPAVDLNVTK